MLKYSAPVNRECDFNDVHTYIIIGKVYRCEITKNLSITTVECADIEDVSGTHMINKTNDDVMVFHAAEKNIQYFPKGLEKFFKNLQIIYMPYNKIKEINQAHIESFPTLKYLEMSHSNVEVLEDGLFDHNLAFFMLVRMFLIIFGI